jgi:autotransporter-associated beta strand protein
VLTATEIRANQTAAANVSTLNLNGGTIVAGPGANANFLHNLTAVNVQSGGAKFDSASNTVNIAQALLDGTGGGGLTKVGAGTLNLNGTNTYTGSTLVSTGALGGSGIIVGPVGVGSGGQLAAGAATIGTLTISNSLTFSNASSAFFRISNAGAVTNNDQVAGLTAVTYNGSLVVSNAGGVPLVVGSTFKLFNSTGAGAGNFTSVTVLPAGSGTFNPATGVLTITSAGNLALNKPFVSNGNLVLTGTGTPNAAYTLLSSTNLTVPLAQWQTNATGTFDVSGNSSNAIPLDATNRFFLLRQP